MIFFLKCCTFSAFSLICILMESCLVFLAKILLTNTLQICIIVNNSFFEQTKYFPYVWTWEAISGLTFRTEFIFKAKF